MSPAEKKICTLGSLALSMSFIVYIYLINLSKFRLVLHGTLIIEYIVMINVWYTCRIPKKEGRLSWSYGIFCTTFIVSIIYARLKLKLFVLYLYNITLVIMKVTSVKDISKWMKCFQYTKEIGKWKKYQIQRDIK